MPILILLTLATACLNLPWPDPFALSPLWSTYATLGLVGVALICSTSLSCWVTRKLNRDPENRAAVGRRYGRCRHLLFFFNLGITATAIIAFGWGQTVWSQFVVQHHGKATLLPYAELAVPGPYLLLLVVNWMIYYPAERALHATARSTQGKSFWSLPAFMLFNLRQFALMILFPLLMTVSAQTLARFSPEIMDEWWFHLASVLSLLMLVVLMPLFVRPLLGLKRFPQSEQRQRLEATAKRLGVRFSDLLLWPTHGAMANAMVVGVVPWARYVIFTDRLLEGMDEEEINAVYGHELGHIRSGHMPYYLGFLMLSMTACFGMYAVLLLQLERYGYDLNEWKLYLELPPLLIIGIYIFLMFGLLSRMCERQADIAGCRAGSCSNKDCYGHTADTILPVGGHALCRTGTIAMIRALDAVMSLNGIDDPEHSGRWRHLNRSLSWLRSWLHGPPRHRIAYLESLLDKPERADRHDRLVFWFRIGVFAVLISLVTLGGSVVGWAELWKRL